jgi:hypothetical protein
MLNGLTASAKITTTYGTPVARQGASGDACGLDWGLTNGDNTRPCSKEAIGHIGSFRIRLVLVILETKRPPTW